MGKSKGKMRSKTKIGVRKPPLSAVDKLIYAMGFLLVIGLLCASVLCYFLVYESIAFRDSAVVARTEDGYGVTFLVVFGGLLETFFFLCKKLSAKQPIFGNTEVTYGVFPWKKDLFPLFGSYPEKEKLKKDTFQKRKKRKERFFTGCLFVAVYLVIMSFFGISGACMQDDNSVTVFSLSPDSVKHVYTTKDFAGLELSVDHHSGGKGSGYWDLSMEIRMEDGTVRRFCDREFRDNEAALTAMTEIKALFPEEAVTIDGAKFLDRVEGDYDAEQIHVLRELFELE